MTAPYRSTPIFDETTLPQGLRKDHSTKAGVWGVIRVLEGELCYTILEPAQETVLTPGKFGLITPQQKHFVTPRGAVRFQVDFYDAPPAL